MTLLEIKVAVVGAGAQSTASAKALAAILGEKVTSSIVDRIASHRVHSFRCLAENKKDELDLPKGHSVTNLFLEENDPKCLVQSLRDDVALSFVHIPGIDDTGASPGQVYMTEQWETFDCIIVVADPFQGEEKHHAHTVKIVKTLLTKRKKMPAILLCHYQKTSGIGLEEGRKLIAAVEEKVRWYNESDKIRSDRSTVASMTIGMMSYDSDKDDDEETACNEDKYKEGAGVMDLDSDDDSAYHTDDGTEFETQWSSHNGQPAYAFGENDRMRTPLIEFFVASSRKMVGAQASAFQCRLQGLVGTADAQTQTLMVQKAVALDKLSTESYFPFVKQLQTVCERYQNVDVDMTLKETVTTFFWDIYLACEDGAFARFEREMNPSRLAFPLDQLCDYQLWIKKLDWKEEQDKIVAAVGDLVRRQLNFVLHKNSLWSFEEWYETMNACGWSKNKLPTQDWNQISPSDWGTIISSLLLASSDRHFYETFGRERIALERARFLSTEWSGAVQSSKGAQTSFNAADGCPSLDHCLDGKYENGRFRPKYKQTFDCVVRFEVPEKLSESSHWGYAAWKHSGMVRSVAFQ